MRFIDTLRRAHHRPRRADDFALHVESLGTTREPPLEEPGEGGPSVFVSEIRALKQSAIAEAGNVGRAGLEPERWENGRLVFQYERHLAHEFEGLRNRLADFVAAQVRDQLEELQKLATKVAETRDALRTTDRDLGTVLSSWNAAYREVHEDELELGRHFRLKSYKYQAIKVLIAVALFLAELAVTTALFDRVVAQDNQALPILFSLGLILVLIVVPHYAAIAIKDGLFSYHEAEMRGYDEHGVHPPVSVRKKARREEIDDGGIKIAAGLIGLALVGLIIPLSSLRAAELGNGENGFFWFSFFLLLQVTISGYFFVREWMDHGAASVNLKHHDISRERAEEGRQSAFREYTTSVSEFDTEAEQLVFLYRAAPSWDGYVIDSFYSTLHQFRHVLTVQHPDLDVFISNAAVPRLAGTATTGSGNEDCSWLPVDGERTDLVGAPFSRAWWLAQVAQTLDPDAPPEGARMFENPAAMLDHLLERRFGLSHPYERPAILDEIQVVDYEPKDLRRLEVQDGSSTPRGRSDLDSLVVPTQRNGVGGAPVRFKSNDG